MNTLDEERKVINKIDSKMAKLFKERMDASSNIAKIKDENNLAIFDKKREDEVIKQNLASVPSDIKKYYEEYLTDFMMISKKYQSNLLNHLTIYTNKTSYDVIVEKGALNKLDELIVEDGKVLIITDSGIPKDLIEKVKGQIKNPYVFTISNGEKSKSIESFSEIVTFMCLNEFTRTDAIVCLGGGMVGDLSGFIASTFMRGIRFYNIPTTLLAQVDSSIGGKTAINFNGTKNLIGSFYSPFRVIIDPTVLLTQSKNEFNSGLVEAIKMALTSDEELFNLIEASNNIYEDIEEIIKRSLRIKKRVVEDDFKEEGLRKILNFGHTVGHAIEAYNGGKLLHGECVGIGMTYFIKDNELKQRVIKLLKKYNLPTSTNISKDELYNYIIHDKKRTSDMIDIITVSSIAKANIERINIIDIKKYL